MIKIMIYFIISNFLLFFSTNFNYKNDAKIFQDVNQAIFRVHNNDAQTSYNSITIDKIEILPKSVLKTGTPNTLIKNNILEINFFNFIKKITYRYKFSIVSILTRYKCRILLN